MDAADPASLGCSKTGMADFGGFIAPISEIPVDVEYHPPDMLRGKKRCGISNDISWIVIAAIIFATVIAWVSFMQSLVQEQFVRRRRFITSESRESARDLIPETLIVAVALTLVAVFVIFVLRPNQRSGEKSKLPL